MASGRKNARDKRVLIHQGELQATKMLVIEQRTSGHRSVGFIEINVPHVKVAFGIIGHKKWR